MNTSSRLAQGVVVLSFVLGLAGPLAASAATTPSLGAAETYGILANTYVNSTATTVNGDVGFSSGPSVAPAGVHNSYGSVGQFGSAGSGQGSATSALAVQPCTFTFPSGTIDLSTDTTHGSAGVYAPGVYCSGGDMRVGGAITLSGSGTYIFRPAGALTSTAGASVTLSGAAACDVFWTPGNPTVLAMNTTFVGNVIDNAGITVGANSTWQGRAMAFYSGTVSTDTDTISLPSCATQNQTPPPAPPGNDPNSGTINVVKRVINDNGGTKSLADFSLYVNGVVVGSGVTNAFPAPSSVYAVTESNDANYTRSFSGDCDINGRLNLNPGDNKFCIITNNDIGAPATVAPVPPLFDVVKVPSPLALPAGPGAVTYTYTLRNTGSVPVTDITMVGDTCSPIVRVSGDANGDDRLDVNETWVHTCTMTLSATRTNTVVATGWANGLTATDIASSTVFVGIPVVPPLIHVTKIPYPLTLPAGGGTVTYTATVTNPGTAPLSNVTLRDDTCAMTFIAGDSNGDAKLDASETWTYTCSAHLTKTTANAVAVSGEANGFLARDFALAIISVVTDPIDPVLVARLKGRILLQVQSHGEAWYVNPDDGKRYYMSNGTEALAIMRKFALGITDKDLMGIPTSASPTNGTSAIALRLRGKILLQVEHNGDAWYVNPLNAKRYFMGLPQDAYNLMRTLGLGITDQELGKIQVGTLD